MIVCERCGDEAPRSARRSACADGARQSRPTSAHNHCMRQQPYSYTEEERGLMSSSTPPNVVFHDHGSSSRASPRINVLENSYPRAIVWGPLGDSASSVTVSWHSDAAPSSDAAPVSARTLEWLRLKHLCPGVLYSVRDGIEELARLFADQNLLLQRVRSNKILVCN